MQRLEKTVGPQSRVYGEFSRIFSDFFSLNSWKTSSGTKRTQIILTKSIIHFFLFPNLVRFVIRPWRIFDQPKFIEDRAILVVRNLLDVQMRFVVRLHSRVSIIGTPVSRPFRTDWHELLTSFLTSRWPRHHVHRRSIILVRFAVTPVINLKK